MMKTGSNVFETARILMPLPPPLVQAGQAVPDPPPPQPLVQAGRAVPDPPLPLPLMRSRQGGVKLVQSVVS